jgi:glutathione peroxidase-family protein
VSADGKLVQRFDSDVTPDSPQLTRAVEQLLN